MSIHLLLCLCLVTLSVCAEEYICSASYDDQSSTITSTFKRTEEGFLGTHLTTSSYADFVPVSEREVYGFPSSKKNLSRGGVTYVVENESSIGFLKHYFNNLTIHWIEFEDIGHTTRKIYGEKEELRFPDGHLLQEDMNQVYRTGSCVKND